MPLHTMVLPLEGGSPSSVMVIVFDDAVMLIYGDCDDEGFLKVDKGNTRCFAFRDYPRLRRKMVGRGGKVKLGALAALVSLER